VSETLPEKLEGEIVKGERFSSMTLKKVNGKTFERPIV
jgi:hypothetical protein